MIEKRYNRIQKTEPKLAKFWCYRCDRAMLHPGGKCPICGLRDKSKRRKK